MRVGELIHEIEQAGEPDRQLDCFIYRHLNPHMVAVRSKPGYFFDPSKTTEFAAEKYHISGGATGIAPRYTESLDAAMTLLDKDTFFHLSRFSFGECEAHVYPNRHVGDDYDGSGATPALALVAAALRARRDGSDVK